MGEANGHTCFHTRGSESPWAHQQRLFPAGLLAARRDLTGVGPAFCKRQVASIRRPARGGGAAWGCISCFDGRTGNAQPTIEPRRPFRPGGEVATGFAEFRTTRDKSQQLLKFLQGRIHSTSKRPAVLQLLVQRKVRGLQSLSGRTRWSMGEKKPHSQGVGAVPQSRESFSLPRERKEVERRDPLPASPHKLIPLS